MPSINPPKPRPSNSAGSTLGFCERRRSLTRLTGHTAGLPAHRPTKRSAKKNHDVSPRDQRLGQPLHVLHRAVDMRGHPQHGSVHLTGARSTSHAVVTIWCSAISLARTAVGPAPSVGRSVVIALGSSSGSTTCQPGTSASTVRVNRPTSARRARTAAGPAARCSPSASENPSRALILASRISSGAHRGSSLPYTSGRTASAPTPRGPASHFRDEVYSTSGPPRSPGARGPAPRPPPAAARARGTPARTPSTAARCPGGCPARSGAPTPADRPPAPRWPPPPDQPSSSAGSVRTWKPLAASIIGQIGARTPRAGTPPCAAPSSCSAAGPGHGWSPW